MDKPTLIERLQNISGDMEVYLVSHDGLLVRCVDVEVKQGVICLHPQVSSQYIFGAETQNWGKPEITVAITQGV